jgi:hypothetical protein
VREKRKGKKEGKTRKKTPKGRKLGKGGGGSRKPNPLNLVFPPASCFPFHFPLLVCGAKLELIAT